MRRRGELVRDRMTAWLRAHLPDLRAVSVDDLDVDARGDIGRRAEIPSDDVLAADLRFLVSVLGRLHATEDAAATTTAAPSPEVSDALASAARTAGRRGAGQGFRLGQADRAAIETHAVTRARRYLEAQGFTVRDVGAVESYDLDATRPGERLHVEVKGTTSTGGEVVLTRNEVLLNAAHHPDTMLIVVSDVDLDRTTTPPRATGGRMRVV